MGVEQIILADQVAGETGEPVRYRISVEEFLMLDEAGAFENVGRVELIEGEILFMSPLYVRPWQEGAPVRALVSP